MSKKKTVDEKAAERRYPEGTVHDAIMKDAFLDNYGMLTTARQRIEELEESCDYDTLKDRIINLKQQLTTAKTENTLLKQALSNEAYCACHGNYICDAHKALSKTAASELLERVKLLEAVASETRKWCDDQGYDIHAGSGHYLARVLAALDGSGGVG